MEDLSKKFPSWFLPASESFINTLHQSDTPLTVEQCNILLKELEQTKKRMTKKRDASGTAAGSENGVDDASFPGNQDLLKNCVLTQMRQYITNPRLASKLKPSSFPGPMASQLSRSKLSLVKDNDYYITEKSDGVRCMMATLFRPHFPRWGVYVKNVPRNAPPGTNPTEKLMNFPLKVSLCLEVQVLNGNFSTPFLIKWIDGSIKSVKLQKNLMNHQGKTIPVYSLQVSKQGSSEYTTCRLDRKTGWQFSYVFDRTFQFNLCLEEFVFLTKRKSLFQQLVILDGEIVWNLRERRYNYTVYDIITVCVEGEEAVQQFQMPMNIAQQRPQHIIPCGHLDVASKIGMIKNDVIDPHYNYYVRMKSPRPSSLQLIRKHFYPKSEIRTILGCITKDAKTGAYLYKNYNKNDGFIFTPALSRLYRFIPGTSNNLVKWKWPDKLTADFSGKIVSRAEGGQPTYMDLYYNTYIKERRGDPGYKGDEIFLKRIDLTQQWNVLDDDTKQVLKEKDACIVECFFDDRFGDWVIHLVRKDKVKANAYHTIIFTLTNVMENITTEDLERICLQPSGNAQLSRDDPNFQKAATEENTYITLRMDADNDILFEVCHHTGAVNGVVGERGSYWDRFNIRVDDLIGPHGETGYDLENVLHEQYDMEIFYPRIIFLPASGYWKILDFGGNEDDCAAETVLLTIEKMTSVALRINRAKQFVPQDHGHQQPQQQQQQQQQQQATYPSYQTYTPPSVQGDTNAAAGMKRAREYDPSAAMEQESKRVKMA